MIKIFTILFLLPYLSIAQTHKYATPVLDTITVYTYENGVKQQCKAVMRADKYYKFKGDSIICNTFFGVRGATQNNGIIATPLWYMVKYLCDNKNISKNSRLFFN